MNPQPNSQPDWLDLVRAKAAGIRFGSLQITLHDGKVVQIECHEKTRLDVPRAGADSRQFAA
jgi:hypothetical protein